MRKTLLATTALACAGAFAIGSASAADKLSVGISGYMQQWVAMTDVDNSGDKTVEGGVSQYSDSEFNVTGKLEADNGLTFSVKIEVEGNSSEGSAANPRGDQIDESQATVSGSFGQIVLGSEDHPASLMHYGNQDVGVGLNCGDPGIIAGITGCAREGKKGLGTAGWLIGGDDHKIAYYTPRMSGVQFGAAYIPDANSEDFNRAPPHNDEDAWSVGLNYKGDMGGASIALSAGHYQASQVADPGMKADDETFSNFGLRVGFGAFGFDVAYAEHDGGAYMADGMKDTKQDYEVASAGIKYTDGPMAVSLSHMAADADDGGEASATMLSMSYSLAPGVASRTSIISGEQDMAEGTAFVTGITIGF